MTPDTDRRRMVVYLTEPEWKWVKLQAGDVPVTRWCHRILLAGMKVESDHRISGVREDTTVREAGGRKPKAGGVEHSKSAPACVHGTAKGFRCWQCGGIAKV